MNDELFFSEQGEILKALAAALINATPDDWLDFMLSLEVTDEGCGHTITSEQHPDDIVAATTDVFDSTSRLEDLFKRRGEPWKRAIIRVWQTPDGKWKFSGTYGY